MSFFATFGAADIKKHIQDKNFEPAFNEILDLVRKNVPIIQTYPELRPFFNEKAHPEFFKYLYGKNLELVDGKFFKEALQIFRLMTLYESDNPDLYKKYRETYVFYTNSILGIKRAITDFQQGEFGDAKKRLSELGQEVPDKSELKDMVTLGQKEIEQRVFNQYIKPGIDRINNYLAQARFNDARAYLGMLQRILAPDLRDKTGATIRLSEQAYYYQKAAESFEGKEYDKAIDWITKLWEIYKDDDDVNAKLSFYKEAKLKSMLQAEAYNNLRQGNLYYDQKQYTRAIEFYQRYLELVPQDEQIQNRVKSINDLLEEQRKKNYFYENYNNAVRLLQQGEYERSLTIFEGIKTYPYEQEKVRGYILQASEELERQKQELEKETQARNYINEANGLYESDKLQEALQVYGTALSLLDEIRGREGLKREVRNLILRTQNRIRALEREQLLERLRRIEQGILRGRREYELGNYDRSLLILQEVLQLDPENLVAEDYINLVQEAQKSQSIGVVSPRDPFFPLFLSLKKEGKDLEKQGLESFRAGREEEGRRLTQAAINKWQTIKRAFPYNDEARLNIRALYKFIDPKGWREAIQDDLDKALRLFESGNRNFAYNIVKEIAEEAPDFPRIDFYLNRVKPKAEQVALSDEQKRLATGLYNEALGQFTRRDYAAALKLTEQIININRRVQDPVLDRAKSLYIRIKSRLQTDTARAPDLKLDQIVKMTKFYRDGLDAYQKGDFQRAVEFAKRALQIDPNYTSAQSLLDSATKRMR